MASKEIANYDEQLAAMAKAATAVERPSTSTIGTRAGVLTYGGQAIPGNKLECIVIASRHTNLFYEGKFDADNPSNPSCYAYGEDEKNMRPHPSVENPQSGDCASCPHNQWGSAVKDGKASRGKACKNSRGLALIPADTKVEDIPTAEIAIMRLPVTSVKNWGNYVNKLATLYARPPLGVVTEIGSQPDTKSVYQITFQPKGMTDNTLLPGLMAKVEAAIPMLEREYEPNAEREAPAENKKF